MPAILPRSSIRAGCSGRGYSLDGGLGSFPRFFCLADTPVGGTVVIDSVATVVGRVAVSRCASGAAWIAVMVEGKAFWHQPRQSGDFLLVCSGAPVLPCAVLGAGCIRAVATVRAFPRAPCQRLSSACAACVLQRRVFSDRIDQNGLRFIGEF